MATIQDVQTLINNTIKDNNNQEITGQVLNNALTAMIDTLSKTYAFGGVATPSTNPGTPEVNTFYLATEVGTYTNMGSVVLNASEFAVIAWNGTTWSKHTIFDVLSLPDVTKKISENNVSVSSTTVDGSFKKGILSLSNGEFQASANRCHCKVRIDGVLSIVYPENIKVSLRFYDENEVFISSMQNWATGQINVNTVAPTNARIIGIVAAFVNDSNISDYAYFTRNIALVKNAFFDIDEINERISDTYTLLFELGTIDLNTGKEGASTTRARSIMLTAKDVDSICVAEGQKMSFRFYKNGEFVGATTDWVEGVVSIADVLPESANQIRVVCAYKNDATISNVKSLIVKCTPTKKRSSNQLAETVFEKGSWGILCAKERTYQDGTLPTTEWFLIGNYQTNEVFATKDFSYKERLFSFFNLSNWSWGVMPNGDVIAVPQSWTFNSGGSDSNRKDSYVFKAGNYNNPIKINFSGLKPCGWLANFGFRTLPNGDVLLCEYTRPTVATSNVWKISGDADAPENWSVVKTFALSGDDNIGFKHCHTIQHDPFTNVVYLTTGDDDTAANIYYSTDGGDIWSQLRDSSEKYCRLLSFTFTRDNICWASDSPGYHYFFKAERDLSGVLTFDRIEEIELQDEGLFATYGQVFFNELNSVLLLDRQDGGGTATQMPIRLVHIDTMDVVTIGNVAVSQSGELNIGFRTTYSELYPRSNSFRVGFGADEYSYNRNGVCGKIGEKGINNVNNLIVYVSNDSVIFDTEY